MVADLDGASSLPGLWAAGETACNGVHGANRLASNSLLDGMVFAPRVVEAIEKGKDAAEPTGAMRAVVDDVEGGMGSRAGGYPSRSNGTTRAPRHARGVAGSHDALRGGAAVRLVAR